MGEPVDLLGCERCGKERPIQQMTMQEDCWFCEPCYADFKAHFDKCEHAWEPYTNCYGESSQYCTNCTGLVRDEDMASVAVQQVAR